MIEAVTVFCTCATPEEAETIGRAVVERRFAACVNIIREVQSIYRWQEDIETAREHLLVIKTTADRFAVLRDCIAELHSYEVPEIIALPVIQGSERYLEWIRTSVEAPL